MTKATCPKCGATLPEPGRPCPRCLFDLALAREPADPAEPAATRPPRAPAAPPSPAELAPLFPELELEALIGSGGMGAVYRARQKRLGRLVALKVLHRELGGDPLFVERFLREAQAMAKLAHPGIVAVHDYGERERRCYLVMEHVDGANLRALLKQGLLQPRQALDVVRQLCDALQFAHDEGVVHRDIKPENVLVDSKGRVKVADFGLAKLVGGTAQLTLTSEGQVMGTPHYMAPEQVERPRDVDHRADLFSLGVVFYEMLTGELPLGRFAPPSQRVQVDVRLDEIVLKTLERERERRYQQAAEVKTDVERVEDGPGTRLEPSSRSGVYLPDLLAALGVRRPNAWGWFGLCTAAWIVCGASFDLGVVWFALISLPLLSWIFLSMVADRTGVEPGAGWKRGAGQGDDGSAAMFVQVELGAGGKRGAWVARTSPWAFASAILGLLALFAAHVASWERGTDHYVPNDQSPLARLEAARAMVEGDELILDRASIITNPHSLYRVSPYLWGIGAMVALLLSARVISPSPSGASRPWKRAVHSLMLFGAPLFSWDALQFFRTAERVRVRAIASTSTASAEEVADLAYKSIIERGYEVQSDLWAHREREGREPSPWRCLSASQRSVFDRWRIGWWGPRRTTPHVEVLVGEVDITIKMNGKTVGTSPVAARVLYVDAGLLQTTSHLRGEWSDWIDTLIEQCGGTPLVGWNWNDDPQD